LVLGRGSRLETPRSAALLFWLALTGCGSGTSGPTPILSEVIPTSAVVGSQPFALLVEGSNFVAGSTAHWDTALRPTTVLSSTQLQLQLSATDLAASGTHYIAVENPAPGFWSDAGVFTVVASPPAYPVVEVPQAANDIAWDSSNGLIYLSIPSTAGTYGNSISALDPDAGTIVASQYAGSEPSRLALSDDNQFLYVGLNGAASVARFTLPDLVPSVEYSLGSTSNGGLLFALDLQVAPGMPHTSAVSVGHSSTVGWAPTLVIFDDSMSRTSVPFGDFDSIQWGADAESLYAANNDTTNFDFYSLAVSPSGASIGLDNPGVEPWLGLFGGHIHYDPGTKLIYSDNSIVVDPASGLAVGSFPSAGWLVPDSSLGRLFVLVTPSTGAAEVAIQVFDLHSAALIATIPLQSVLGNPLRFIRWGPRGLAICTDAGYIYLITGGFIDGSD